MINRLDISDCIITHKVNPSSDTPCEVHVQDGLALFPPRTFFVGKTFKEAYELAEEASVKFERLNDRIHLVDALTLAGKSVYQIKNAKAALTFFNRVPQHNPSKFQLATLESLRGNIYLENRNAIYK